ncbi:MAG: hypothetical protein WCP77_17320 [Roseococcus sp.]
MEKKKGKRGARPPIAKEAPTTWPSGFEIAEWAKPPAPDNIREQVAGFKRLLDQGHGYDPVLRAFEHIALARRHGVQWGATGIFTDLPKVEPDNAVFVPWWALVALVGAIQAARNGKRSLDEVMGLKGVGSGKRSWAQDMDDISTHLCRAVEVRHLMELGQKKMPAVALVAERYKISAEAVRASLKAAVARGFILPPSKRKSGA